MNVLAGEKRAVRLRAREDKWDIAWAKWVKKADARLAEQLRRSDERLAQQCKLSDERFEQAMARNAERFNAEMKLLDERLAQFRAMFADERAKNDKFTAHMDESLVEFKRESRNTRVIVVTTGIASVMAIAAFNATVLSNMVASYESGKSTAAAITQATERLDRLQERTERTAALVDAWYAQMTEQDGTIKKPSKR